MFFFVCTIGRRLLRILPRNQGCQGPFIFLIFLVGAFGMCIGGGDTPAIWDRS